MTDERDELIERVRAALREPPMVDATARARVLVAVAAERERAAGRSWAAARVWRWSAAAAGIVVAAVLIGRFASPTAGRDRASAPRSAIAIQSPESAAGAATLVHDATDHVALRRVQLVFRAPRAHRVSLVGDFTEWDAHQAPMARDSASGLWSVTVAVRPGRHVYAFLVDDSTWVQDPRAMEAPDADFGRPGSVLLVGQP